MRCFFPSFQDCYNCASLLPRWDGDIYARHKARHSYRDRIGAGGGGSPETCRTDISSHIFISFPLSSPPHIFPHTPFPILSLSFCSSSHHHLQLRAEEMLKCQSDSENFLEKKLSLPSTPEQASLPPSSTRSITFGIYLPGFHGNVM